MPSTSTVGDWLRRHGNSLGLKALKKVIDITTRKALSMDKRKEYTLDTCQENCGHLKLPIENYVLDYFVILTLSLSEGEESHPFSPNRFFN